MCGQYTLELQSPEIQHLCKKDKRLARVISAIGPLTYSLHQDAYSFLIREIIEQMMSVKAASVIYGRLVDLCSGNVTPDTISSLTDDQLRSTGTSKAKVEYIRNVTRAVKQGIWNFDSMYSMTDAEIIKLMTSVREIGNWTAKMYLMFVLGRPDPLYRLIHDEPNKEMTSFILRETLMAHLLLYGNVYCQIIRTGRDKIDSIYPLLPDKMEVDRDAGGLLTYTYTTSDGKRWLFNQRDVLHIPGLGFDGVMGYSPIALEKSAIGLGIAAEEYGSKFFSNGARPSGILTHPNTVRDPAALRASWNAAYGGSTNASRVAVLEEGMTFVPLSLPNNEAQFLETRKFQVAEICRIYRVPPHMIGDLDRATFSNIEHQSIDFAVHTIRPWLVRIEQSINRALFSEKEKGRFYVQFNMDGLMRGDYKSRMEGYAIARQNGWMSANDIRELENMNPMSDEEGGNTYLVNGNMIPVNLAGITAFLAAAAAVQAEDGDQENTPEQEETQSVENSSRKRRKPKGVDTA